MTFLLRYWPHLLALALAFGAGAWFGYWPGAREAVLAQIELGKYRQQAAEQIAAAEQMARQAEHRHAADMARIGQEHQEALRNAQAGYDRTVADLRAGNLRLQERWRSCAASLPGPGGAGSSVDAAADDRSESAGRIVRAAAECDAQVIGLQGIIRADRAKTGD